MGPSECLARAVGGSEAHSRAAGRTTSSTWLRSRRRPFRSPERPPRGRRAPNGLVRGDVVLVTETTQEDLQKYAGKLKGKWILTQPAPDVRGVLDRSRDARNAEELERMELATATGATNSA